MKKYKKLIRLLGHFQAAVKLNILHKKRRKISWPAPLCK